MYKCQICGKTFENDNSLYRHVGTRYKKERQRIHCSVTSYLLKYDQRCIKSNLERMYYQEMKSTPQISKELGIAKQRLLFVMHEHGIQLRGLSEAAKNQLKRDGLWNKGQTKDTHTAVKKYADSRRGKNNPYYTAPGYEERHRKNCQRFKGIANKVLGNRNPKTTEARMCKILDGCGLQYIRNFCIRFGDSWRLYDFLIEGELIVEMQGNYYHANPNKYSADDLIVVAKKKRKASEIWEYDAKKKQLAIDSGYTFFVLWEKDFSGMIDDEVVAEIGQHLKVDNE